MPAVDQVERGTATWLSTETATKDITIPNSTVVDTARTVVLITWSLANNTDRSRYNRIYPELTSSTNLRLNRNSAASAPDTDIHYQIIEFSSGELTGLETSVELDINSTSDVYNKTIASVDTDYALPIIYDNADDSDWTNAGFGNGTGYIYDVTTATNLKLTFSGSAGPATGDNFDIAWQVVEFKSGNTKVIKKNTLAIGAGSATAVSGSFTPDVDTTAAFIHGGGWYGTVAIPKRYCARLYFSGLTGDNADTITAKRSTFGSEPATTVQYFIVEFTDTTTVQHNTQAIDSTSPDTTALGTSVTAANSTMWSQDGILGVSADFTDSADESAQMENIIAELDTDGAGVTFSRLDTPLKTYDAEWHVIEWGGAAGGATVKLSNLMMMGVS